jgi:hypothetical protein
VVVDDFDIGRSFLGPSKADAPLIVDSNRVLSVTTPREHFKPIPRRGPQIVEIARNMQQIEFSLRLFFDAAETLYKIARPKQFRGAIPKRPNHTFLSNTPQVLRQAYNSSRQSRLRA